MNPCFHYWKKCPCFNPNAVSINELQWINIDGSVIDGAQGMTNNTHIANDDIAQVLQGNVLVDTSRLVFRDPEHFVVCRLFSDVGSNRELHGDPTI